MTWQKPFNKFQPKKEQAPPHNFQIRGKQVRIVQAENAEHNGIHNITDAIRLAQSLDVDLVAINTQQEIPICRLIPVDKYMYEQKQKEKQQKKQATTSEMKELRFSPEISDNDISYRVKNACEWLGQGNKVRVTVQFRGRQMQHKERGELVLLQFADKVKECGLPEQMPQLEGKRLYIVLKPKAKK
jgi:translation initiation factor IF-3